MTPSETSLLVTEPYFNLPNIAETYDQMVFEEWEFASYYRCTRMSRLTQYSRDCIAQILAASLIPYGGLFEDDSGIPPECTIVVDVGYSFTHVVPIREGQIIWEHVKRYVRLTLGPSLASSRLLLRIDIGGKLLTNHLKHLISFRQWNMSDQTAVIDAIREQCCYISMDYKRDLDICK